MLKQAEKEFLLALGAALLELLNIEGMEPVHDELQRAIDKYDEAEDDVDAE